MDEAYEHPISDLVGAFLEAAQTVVASGEAVAEQHRPAELTYELDQVVSNYLDAHQLSTEHYDVIQQDVLNTIARQLAEESSRATDTSHTQLFDHQGNAGLADLLTLLDHHVVGDLVADLHADAAGLMPGLQHHPHPG
jgi:hypothetical protein